MNAGMRRGARGRQFGRAVVMAGLYAGPTCEVYYRVREVMRWRENVGAVFGAAVDAVFRCCCGVMARYATNAYLCKYLTDQHMRLPQPS